jgi:hypothetical protein
MASTWQTIKLPPIVASGKDFKGDVMAQMAMMDYIHLYKHVVCSIIILDASDSGNATQQIMA